MLIVGLAPAANGGNRTGRNFTGDRSGDWIHAALHRTGLATQASSTHAGDGQRLPHTRMVATVRCAPPANKPTPEERATCAPWLHRELTLLLPTVQRSRLPRSDRLERRLDGARPTSAWRCRDPGPASATAPRCAVGDLAVLGCYHPSPHNTFTGRLTEDMVDAVLTRAASLADSG